MRHPRLTLALAVLFWFRLPVVVAIIATGKLIIGAGLAHNSLYG